MLKDKIKTRLIEIHSEVDSSTILDTQRKIHGLDSTIRNLIKNKGERSRKAKAMANARWKKYGELMAINKTITK